MTLHFVFLTVQYLSISEFVFEGEEKNIFKNKNKRLC